jgi:light-regulated signal transduction histidine kinase (bacteriophytochrome)
MHRSHHRVHTGDVVVLLFVVASAALLVVLGCRRYLATTMSRPAPSVSGSVDAAALTRRVVRGFEHRSASSGVRLQLHIEPAKLDVAADEAVLTSALWNLLDGAVSYSTGAKWVHVFVQRRGAAVVIGVRNRSIGVRRSRPRELVLPLSV